MNSKYILIPDNLTSYEFYNAILPMISEVGESGNDIVLDFSHIKNIDSLVIPNLLCLGQIWKNKYSRPIIIYIPDTYYSGKVKKYLFDIGFTEYAEYYGLFDFIGEIWGGLAKDSIDPICKTIYFSAKQSDDDIIRTVELNVKPFAEKYISDFESIRECEDGFFYSNDIVDFLTELVINSKIHAKSISFATLAAKYSTKKICLAVSDCGEGFSSTIGKEMKANSEEEAIMLGIYKRDQSKVYGLYNIIKQIIECGGKVRIHSNDTQMIFTQKVMGSFLEKRLNCDEFRKYNIRESVLFEGVHVELEIPFERRQFRW